MTLAAQRLAKRPIRRVDSGTLIPALICISASLPPFPFSSAGKQPFQVVYVSVLYRVRPRTVQVPAFQKQISFELEAVIIIKVVLHS